MLHHAVEVGGNYDFNKLHNRYFTVNGREFPDTIQDNGVAWLPNQPYGALVRVQPLAPTNPLPALIRMVNAGELNHPYHPHGNHLRLIAQDGRLLLSPGGADASSEHFAETIASGQAMDLLFKWTDQDAWNATTKPIPSPVPTYRNLMFKDNVTWFSGSAYLGNKGTLPTGVVSYNVCGEYYFPWHSHALNEFTNFDEGFGGMATLLRVDPLGGCVAYPNSTKISTTPPGGTLKGGSVLEPRCARRRLLPGQLDDDGHAHHGLVRAVQRHPDRCGEPEGHLRGERHLGLVDAELQHPGVDRNDVLDPSGWLDVLGIGNECQHELRDRNGIVQHREHLQLRLDRQHGPGVRRPQERRPQPDHRRLLHEHDRGHGHVAGDQLHRRAVAATAASGQGADRLDFQISTNATSLTTGLWADVKQP